MTSLRSSVRPSSSKQPWGTILHPEFGMGHQRMTEYEVSQTVNRLYYVPEPKQRVYDNQNQKQLPAAQVQEMLKRLTKDSSNNVTDAKRTQRDSIYKDMGCLNSFAWKGYN